MTGPRAAASPMTAPSTAYMRARDAPVKLPRTSVWVAGRSSAAPRPSMTDQNTISIATFTLSAVPSDPRPYTQRPRTKARLRPMTSPSLPPSIIVEAITSA